MVPGRLILADSRVCADALAPTRNLTTERGARTMTVDETSHRIYRWNAKSRTDPNSFKVLVYGIDDKK